MQKQLDRIIALPLIALLALLLWPTLAVAQISGPGSAKQPLCWPAQVPDGTGSRAVRVTRDYGQAIAWWCGQEAFGLVSSWAHTLVIPEPMPARTVDALAALWAANVVADDAIDATERTQLTQDTIIALQPLRPAEKSWSVAPNASYPTRPVYTLAPDGKLGATTLRVDVLTNGKPTPCNCATAATPADRVPRYCAIPQPKGTTPPRVAVCSFK